MLKQTLLQSFIILFLSNILLGQSYYPDNPPNPGITTVEKYYLDALSNSSGAFITAPATKLDTYLKSVGITLTSQSLQKLKSEFQEVVNTRQEAMMSSVTFALLKMRFPYLTDGQASKLYNKLKNETAGNLDATDRLFATLFFISQGIEILTEKEIILMQTKAVVEPSQPSSPTMTLTKSTIGGVINNMANNFKINKAGGLSLSNTYISYDYSYQEYEFTDTDDAGHVHYNSLTYGGNFSEKFSFAFSFFQDQTDQRGTNDLFSNQLGANLALTLNLNENYSIGAYGFYSEADIEDINSHTWTYGGGLLFATYHSFGDFSLSTVNTILKSYTNFEHDTLFISNLRVGYQISDKLSVGTYGFYVDSIREPVDIDSSYMTFGFDINYQLTDQINVSVGIETTEFLKDYRSEVLSVSLRYDF